MVSSADSSSVKLVATKPLASAPPRFPCEVAFPVREEPAPYAVQTIMWFGNNFLVAQMRVLVVNFDPPTETAPGSLAALCESEADYRELRRFVDEPHG